MDEGDEDESSDADRPENREDAVCLLKGFFFSYNLDSVTQPVKMAAEYANHDLWNLKTSSAGTENSTCCLKMYLKQLHAGHV